MPEDGKVRIRPDVLQATLLDEIAGRLLEVHEGLGGLGTKLNRIETLLTPVTYVVDKDDFTITTDYEVVDKKGKGKMHELLLKSLAKDYSLRLEVDGRTLGWEKEVDYDKFVELSADLDYIVAEQRDSYYTLHISDVRFIKSLKIRVVGSLTFDKLHCKYEITE